jgi:hypothetical protein
VTGTPLTDILSVRADPGMTPGSALVRPAVCAWNDKVQGQVPHQESAAWRLVAGCEHEHIETAWLCDRCGTGAQRLMREGVMLCRRCDNAGERRHYCQVRLIEAAELREVQP